MFTYNSLSIRPVEASDLMFLKKLRTDKQTWFYLTSIGMLTDEDQLDWYNSMRSDLKREYFVIVQDSTSVGVVRFDEINHLNKSIRVGADIVPHMRGKGLGTSTYRLILKYCFDYINMNRVWLLVLDYNKIGLHLYQKVGFIIEGRMREAVYRDGNYHDQVVMSILRNEYRNG